MKLKSLKIEDFRHIQAETITFGDKLTVISGQNGTGKSSILGWVAQLCDFKKRNRRLNDLPFKEDFQNVFRFCPTNDYSKNYKVIFEYEEEDGTISNKTVTTRFQKETDKTPSRYRTDIDGRGKTLDTPIIYLGLKRLIPLATEKKISVKSKPIPSTYQKRFSSLSKEILILIDDKISPEGIKSSNKDLLAMKTANYGHLGNSAGQDNIGQIISSILSFDQLKKDLGDQYQGGILLIDELDATLYAGSQINLINRMYRLAESLNIQIIFTTHSLEIIENLEGKLGLDTTINHLLTLDGKVKNILNPTYEYVYNKIKNQTSQEDKIKKRKFICEDEVAKYWIKNLILGTELKSQMEVEEGPFSDGSIVKMAESKHSLFKDVGFILDGDIRKKFANKKDPPKTVFLPGEARPETVLYEFVKSLSDTDSIWDDAKNFTKQTCFGSYQESSKGSHKRWFQDDTNKRFFGRGYAKLLKRWKDENEEAKNLFLDQLRQQI